MIRFIIATILVLFFGGVGFSENTAAKAFVDRKVANLTVGEDRKEMLTRLYGYGLSQKHTHGETFCYYSDRDQTYLTISLHDDLIESIILSKKPEQDMKECVKAVVKNRILRTGKGIQLDTSPKKVTHMYGEPTKREYKNGVLVFEYHTNNEITPEVRLFYDAYLYFKDEKLIKLVIHDGE